MSILTVEKLNKSFGKKQVLKDVNFSLDKGDILAFIGPNGSGKTTTIKCILGLTKMTSGKICINGFDIKKDFVKAIDKVGCLVEAPDVYMYLTGYQNLKMQSSYYKNISEEEIEKVIKLVGLETRIHEKVSKYSLGMRQRLGIAISLINKPNLLILDEPTNGLDPEGIKELRDLLKSLAANNIGILISSHNLSELESFCNKVLILSNGCVLEENTIGKLKQTSDNKYKLKVEDTSKLVNILSENDKIIDEHYVMVKKEEQEIPEFIEMLINKKILIYEIKKEDITLEEAFINKAGGNKID